MLPVCGDGPPGGSAALAPVDPDGGADDGGGGVAGSDAPCPGCCG
jgi:hypothetical protein